MNVQSEIAYQKRAPELVEQVSPTPTKKFAEYANPSHPEINALHCFLASIHRLKPRRIYELGAGAGQLTTRLAKVGYEITAVELSPELLELAKERAKLDGVDGRIRFVLGDVLSHREQGAKFDLVIASLVLHHLDLDLALDAIGEHLAPGGSAIMFEPVAFSPWLQWIRDRCGVPKDISPNERQLDAREIAQICARFEEVHISYFYLFERLSRVFPVGRLRNIVRWPLARLDGLLLPWLKYFCGSVVIEAHRVRS